MITGQAEPAPGAPNLVLPARATASLRDLRVPGCPDHRPGDAQRDTVRARRLRDRCAHPRSRVRTVLRHHHVRGRRPACTAPGGGHAAQRARRAVAADRSFGGGARGPHRGCHPARCPGRRHRRLPRAARATVEHRPPARPARPGRPGRAGPRGQPGVRRRPPPQVVHRARRGRPRRQRTAPRSPRRRTHRRLGRALPARPRTVLHRSTRRAAWWSPTPAPAATPRPSPPAATCSPPTSRCRSAEPTPDPTPTSCCSPRSAHARP